MTRPRMTRPRMTRSVVALAAVAAAATVACVEIGTGPAEPAAIELPPFASPSIVIGDTLRDINGVVAPVRAIVRNVRGEEIADVLVQYLYAPVQRDSALVIDPVSGIVRAIRASNSEPRIAARVGGNLQVLRSIIVTQKPDSLVSAGLVTELRTVLPDTGRTNWNLNTTPTGAEVRVRHKAETAGAASSDVNGWPVRFELVSPANPTNDTSASVFLVNNSGTASTLDTTDNSGRAGRRVRVRAVQFPVGAADLVVVRATASYRGVPLLGSPVLISVPVRRGGVAP